MHGCFLSFDDFERLASFTMFYFAGADHSERRRRAGEFGENDAYVNAHDPEFRSAVARAYEAIRSGEAGASFARETAAALEPYNHVGLCDPTKRNLYPYE